jgi:hypothetical protein
MEWAIKKVSHGSHQSPQSHFAVPIMEGMALGPLPVRTLASLAAHYADPQKYTGSSTAEGKAARFFHGTKLPISLETKGGGETKRGTKLPFCHGGEEENWAGKAPRRGRGSLRLLRGNDDVGYGQVARGAASRSPRRPRQGARRKPSVLTIKAGMWFCFKGIMLATPPSIKDSDGDPREGAARAHPQERCAAALHGVRPGPAAEGVETKAGKCKKTGG